MRIQNIDPDVTRISHGDEEYDVTKEGVFDLPHEAAQQLTRAFPHMWRIWDGLPWPHPKSPEELEAERMASVVEKVLVAKKPARKAAKPKKAAAPAPAAIQPPKPTAKKASKKAPSA